MRPLIVAAAIALFAPAIAGADGMPFSPNAALSPIADRESPLMLSYDAESLSGLVELDFGRGRIEFGISNLFELPEFEPASGFYLDENTLLSEELFGIEVDTGNERAVSLTFSLLW